MASPNEQEIANTVHRWHLFPSDDSDSKTSQRVLLFLHALHAWFVLDLFWRIFGGREFDGPSVVLPMVNPRFMVDQDLIDENARAGFAVLAELRNM